MDKSKPNKEFIKFIVNKLRRERGFISASSLSMAMKQSLPIEFQPDKGYFNKWMEDLYNLEINKSDKNMPYYQLNENNIIEKIKKDYNFWNTVNEAYITKHNNIETWNNLYKIFETQCKNFEIVKNNRPELYNSLSSKYKIHAMPPKPETQLKNKVITQPPVKAWTQPQVKVVTQPPVKVEVQPPVKVVTQSQVKAEVQTSRAEVQTSRPVSKSILKKPIHIQTPPKQVSINLPYEIFSTLPHELPNINNQPYIDSLSSVGSLLFPNINNYNKYENLTQIVKNLNHSDIELLYNFRTFAHENKLENLYYLFNEIIRVKN